MLMSDYEDLASSLTKATVFQGLSKDEIFALLVAMRPRLVMGLPPKPPTGEPHRCFWLVAKTIPERPEIKGRFAYGMQPHGEIGMMMGEILVFSRKEEFVKPTPLSIKPRLPQISWDLILLEFTPEMITGFYSEEISLIQGKMIRNLLGMLAQKVVDVRRELYLERSGYDIYADSNIISK